MFGKVSQATKSRFVTERDVFVAKQELSNLLLRSKNIVKLKIKAMSGIKPVTNQRFVEGLLRHHITAPDIKDVRVASFLPSEGS